MSIDTTARISPVLVERDAAGKDAPVCLQMRTNCTTRSVHVRDRSTL